MATPRSKFQFLVRVLRHRWNRQPCICPYCGVPTAVRLLRRKKLVLRILQCQACKLIFRWPTETADEAFDYYQDQYAALLQANLPRDNDLRALMERDFAGSHSDIGNKIAVLKAVRPAGRLLDYGCSWGHGTYQLARAGFQVVGFEISKPRAQYAREKLHVEVVDDFGRLQAFPAESFDIIFSNHVLEHLANLRDAFDLMFRLLRKGGLAFHVLPNFTGKTARRGMWIAWIGEEHPIAPTIEFFEQNLPRHRFQKLYFGSSPFDNDLASRVQEERQPPQTAGDELLVVAYRTP